MATRVSYERFIKMLDVLVLAECFQLIAEVGGNGFVGVTAANCVD
ncbi:MAG: hypothetical protein WBV55_07865 [Candidatus Sulfotelmatobacter sp.]